jgi:hypothetical protein
MRQLLAGMSPRLGVSQVPCLRTEAHFGAQARALPMGLHKSSVFTLLFHEPSYLFFCIRSFFGVSFLKRFDNKDFRSMG